MKTRQRILNHLKRAHRASAREIARALNLSAPNVRHHLGVLASDGRVEAGAVVKQGERGRPEKFYSLSQAALGDNLSVLADALLNEKVNLEAVGERIAYSQGMIGMANQPMPKRLSALVDKLTEMHYQARWEAGAEGPHLIFGRCPYAKVIENHPELCRLDMSLLEKSLGRPIAQTAKVDASGRGVCPFVFRVG
ncbi:MAG TPA: winged helix-turn-helix transcriptional regulator [Anaerolineales bacterium]|nr:winged helix-turn-helix transcriptional regulator [Anaerolineales bacterium]